MTNNMNHPQETKIKKVTCWASPGCYNHCRLRVTVKNGRIFKITGDPGTGDDYRYFRGCPDRLPYFINWLYHPDQLMHPLKRIGQRGENKWEKISWEQALDEIADKLLHLKKQHGAESLAVTEGTERSDLYGIRTRFLNLFGNPRNIGDPGVVCSCNKKAMKRALLGTSITFGGFEKSKCVVLDGHNITETARGVWQQLAERRKKDPKVKLIVIDPRQTKAAKEADIWLQIRPGTDAALFMAWINIIIEERLYDESFVKQWTFGFDKLKERASEYSIEKVSDITWIPEEKIIESARLYATSKPASIGQEGVAPDEIGLNSMRVEQAKICLRAITGNTGVLTGETTVGPGPIIDGKIGILDSMIQLEEMCTPEQRKKQIGSDRFRLMTWQAYDITNKLYHERYNMVLGMSGHDFVGHQPSIWRAILTENPYPIKAMITWGSNPLLNAANTKLVYQALKSPKLELHIVLEHFMTPTALLADYVFPAASKFEKPMCSTSQDFMPTFQCGEKAIPPMGKRRSDYSFWRGIAIRLGFGEYFPWKDEEELADYRLKPLGITFKEAATKRYTITSTEPWTYKTNHPKTGEPTGFATPSGKVELYSNVLESLGYDPLPFYEEPPESPIRTPDVAKKYPLILITGGRYRPFFHSDHRQLGTGMREQHPDPLMDIHPDTAHKLRIAHGDWAYIETKRGRIKQKANITDGIDPRVINIESHWWFPEQPAKEPSLHGLWQSNANVLTMDDPDICDPISGGWALRALLCRVYPLE